jgi:hypothetical protein
MAEKAKPSRVFQSWILVTERPLERVEEAAEFFGRSAAADPDVLVVQPEADKVAVSIEQVRDILSLLTTHSLTGRERLVIFAPADTLSLPAQQSLLKLLEEPPEKVTLALLTRSAGSLPETIRSRCLVQKLGAGRAGEGERGLLWRLAEAKSLADQLRWLEALPKEREALKPILAETLGQAVPPTGRGIRIKQGAVAALEGLQANVTPGLCLSRLLDNP